jgi:hypothetical protein
MGIWSWLLSALSIVGALLNALGKVFGFYLWIVADIGWIIVEIYLQQWAQVPMWAVYTVISIIGIIMWKRKKIGESK